MLVVLADGRCERLSFGQGLVNCLTSGDHLGELLRNLIAKLLEFVDVDVLDSDVGDGIHSRVSDVGMRD